MTVRPPDFRLLLVEQLATIEYATFLSWRTFLMPLMANGEGQPVLVLPGFTASDRSTGPLRSTLQRKGFWVHGWRLGMNVGPHRRIVDGLRRRLEELHERHEAKVSLVGWSLGGVYARELARADPDAVRQVITLGSPFRLRPGDRSRASTLYDAIAPRNDPFLSTRPPEHERPPLSVPATSIYTRTDGIVRWHVCIEEAGPARENIEVIGTHSGLGFNMAAVIAVADRLAQPESEWAPFRPPPLLFGLYRPAMTWGPRPPTSVR